MKITYELNHQKSKTLEKDYSLGKNQLNKEFIEEYTGEKTNLKN